MTSHPWKRLFSRNRTRGKSATRHRHRSLRAEPLQPRMMLSTIAWENLGVDDNFSAYGSDQSVAVETVERAIADWERIIQDFNYASHTEFELDIKAASISGRGVTRNIDIESATGKPISAEIELAISPTNGWYFDETVGTSTLPDDSEFDSLVTPFTASITDGSGDNDFYRTILHEIGHAMGIANTTGLAIHDFLTELDSSDPNSPGDTLWEFDDGHGVEATFTTDGGLHLFEGAEGYYYTIPTHPHDLMNAGRTMSGVVKPRRQLISDTVAEILEVAYDYDVVPPSYINTFYANLNTDTGVLTVQGDPGDADDTIDVWHDGIFDDVYVRVNDMEEVFPESAVSSVVVNLGDGTDTFGMQELPTSTPITINGDAGTNTMTISGPDDIGEVTVNGGSGTDTLVIDYRNSYGNTYMIGDDYVSQSATTGNVHYDTQIEQLEVVGGSGTNTYLIYETSPQTTLTIEEFTGPANTFCIAAQFFGAGGDLDTIQGDVFLHGVGSDVLNVLDFGHAGNETYTLTDSTFTRDGMATIFYEGFQSLSIEGAEEADGSKGGSIYQINSTPAGVDVTITGSNGDDTFNVGNGIVDDAIVGNLTVIGGGGDDTLVFDDHDDTGSDQYRITATTFSKSSLVEMTWIVRTMNYSQIDSLLVTANGDSNDCTVESLLGADLELNAGGGNDYITVGGGDVTNNMLGGLSVHGDDGTDTIYVADGPSGIDGDTFVITSDTLTKTNPPPIGNRFEMSYDTVEGLTLKTGDMSNTIRVESTDGDVSVEVDTGEGNDEIQIGTSDDLDGIQGAVTVESGNHADTIYVNSSASSAPVAIDAGQRSDTIHIGGNAEDGHLGYVAGPVTAVGGDGDAIDRLFLHDQDHDAGETYTVESNAVARTNDFGGVMYAGFEGLILYASSGTDGDTINVESTLEETPVTVYGRTGPDEVHIGVVDNGDIDSSVVGQVTVYGGFGIDSIYVHDQDDLNDDHYTITHDSLTKATSAGIALFGGLEYSTLEKLVLAANQDDNTIHVDSTHDATPVEILAGGGEDVVHLARAGADGFLKRVPARVTLDGGDQDDRVILHDQSHPVGETYTITSTRVRRANGFGGLDYEACEELFLLTSGPGSDTIDVESTLGTTPVTVNCHGGDDTVNLAAGLLDAVEGAVTVHGGPGVDTVNTYDQNDTGKDDYTITVNTLTKSSVTAPSFGGLTYDVEFLNLDANDSANVIDVDSVSDVTVVTIDGHDGHDQINIATATHNMDADINNEIHVYGNAGATRSISMTKQIAAMTAM